MIVYRKYTGWVEGRNPTTPGLLKSDYILFLVFILLILPAITSAEENKYELPPLHHIVKVKPPSDMKVAKDFPLNKKGEIDCQTCHGIKDIENIPFDDVDKKADNFHRGGPYKQLTDFCYNCHEKQDYQRPNIHKLLDDNGEYDEKACEYCHKKAPDPKKDIVREKLEFRLPPQKLCIGCHLKTPHLNALLHQVKPDKTMFKRIKNSEQKLEVILPLDREGKLMCATCHTPHPPGLISETKPAGKQVTDADLDDGIRYEDHAWNKVYMADKKDRLAQLAQANGKNYSLSYQRLKHEVLLRLPAKDGSLCQACHQFER